MKQVPGGWPGWRMRTWRSSKIPAGLRQPEESGRAVRGHLSHGAPEAGQAHPKIHLSEDTAADPYVALVKRLAVADKLDFDTAKLLIQSYKNERGGCVMAIITTLVGLGVLLVFTVLGCVLEVFLARRESIWPGLALPILAGLYAVVMALSYTAAPDTPWNQVLGGVLAVFLVSGIPAFFATDGVLYLPQWQAPEKAAGKNECAGSVMPACGGILCTKKTPRTGSSGTGAPCLRRSFIFRMQRFVMPPRSRKPPMMPACTRKEPPFKKGRISHGLTAKNTKISFRGPAAGLLRECVCFLAMKALLCSGNLPR